jgi:hypothetical protein
MNKSSRIKQLSPLFISFLTKKVEMNRFVCDHEKLVRKSNDINQLFIEPKTLFSRVYPRQNSISQNTEMLKPYIKLFFYKINWNCPEKKYSTRKINLLVEKNDAI